MLDRYRVNQPTVIHQTIDDETVIIHLERGFYYSLDVTGAAVWQALAAGHSAGQVSDGLAARYPDQRAEIETAVHALLERLQAEGLIVPADTAGATDGASARSTATQDTPAGVRAAGADAPFGPPATPGDTFLPPKLERFDDLQDLLLLDPIHAVDESGWPERPRDP